MEENNFKFIDLGLSVKWATCNLGAGSPEEYGDYHTFDEAQKLDVQVPSIEQWKELIEKCEWTWTWKGKGCRVTGKNGNSIFLPAAGIRDNSNLYRAGYFGFYWSSSVDTDYPRDAWGVYFYSDNTDYPDYAWYVFFDSGYVTRYYTRRYYGFSVRPVSE